MVDMSDKFKTDYTHRAGPAALGARLRRLVDAIDGDVARAYQSRGVKFEQRWFGLINQLLLHGPMTVSEIAEALRITHVSISQSRQSLEKAGYITSAVDPEDQRRRLLSMTPAGNSLVEELLPLWRALEATAIELNKEAEDAIAALERLDAALRRRSMFDRIEDHHEDMVSARK